MTERAAYSGSWRVAITSGVTQHHVYLGAWLGGAAPLFSKIRAFQAASGRHLDLINVFADWKTTFPEIKSWWLNSVYQNHSLAMITWQPNSVCPSDIANGKEDSYITEFAADVARFQKHIFIRPMHEMNFTSPQNPYEWTIGGPCKTTNATFIAAWKRIVWIFRKQNARNALFVWCINNVSSTWTGASFMGAYPGDKWVALIGIDGYNWAYYLHDVNLFGYKFSVHVPSWESFDQLFDGAYAAVTRKTDKQIFITEWSSAEPSYPWQESKANWITNAFEQVTSADFEQVRGLVWFNENKERDWRIDSSAGAEKAYRNAIACLPNAGY